MHNILTCDCPDYCRDTYINIQEQVKNTDLIFANSKIFSHTSKMNEERAAVFTVLYQKNFCNEMKIKLSKINSVYQAELVDIYYAIDWFLKSKFNYVSLYIDSYFCFLQLKIFFQETK